MEDDMLISILKVMSMDANWQTEYVRKLFEDKYYESIDEILLEYDDAMFLRDKYVSNTEIENMFGELDEILDEINRKKIFSIDDLNNVLWNKVRIKARQVLNIIRNSYRKTDISNL